MSGLYADLGRDNSDLWVARNLGRAMEGTRDMKKMRLCQGPSRKLVCSRG